MVSSIYVRSPGEAARIYSVLIYETFEEQAPSPSYTKTNLERQTLISNNEVFINVRYLIVKGNIIQQLKLISVLLC